MNKTNNEELLIKIDPDYYLHKKRVEDVPLREIMNEFYPCQFCDRATYCQKHKVACKGYMRYVGGGSGWQPGHWKYPLGMPNKQYYKES